MQEHECRIKTIGDLNFHIHTLFCIKKLSWLVKKSFTFVTNTILLFASLTTYIPTNCVPTCYLHEISRNKHWEQTTFFNLWLPSRKKLQNDFLWTWESFYYIKISLITNFMHIRFHLKCRKYLIIFVAILGFQNTFFRISEMSSGK